MEKKLARSFSKIIAKNKSMLDASLDISLKNMEKKKERRNTMKFAV